MVLLNAIGHPFVKIPKDGGQYFHKLHYRLRNRLPVWIIYKPITIDYPGVWVARMHVTLPESKRTRFVMTHDDLDLLRSMLPPGLSWMSKHFDDDPVIEEIWI